MLDSEKLARLFVFLKDLGYCWEPALPERLQSLRKDPKGYALLERFFGVGLPADVEELQAEGMDEDVARFVSTVRPAVSRFQDTFVAHTHWSQVPSSEYVYLGKESFGLAERLLERKELFAGKNILDLGSGSGILALALGGIAAKILGIESTPAAVGWARASARAQGLNPVFFECAKVGTPDADRVAGRENWDIAVANPPYAIPAAETRPHRDGGKRGIEIPLLFIDFAFRHLKPGGRWIGFVTNPIVRGRSAFFERIDKARWKVLDRELLDDRFNQSLYRKEKYLEQGVERVEHWFIHLEKRK